MPTPTIETLTFRPNGLVPNSTYPLIVYRAAIVAADAEMTAETFEALFEANGWGGRWRNGIYDYHHFHDSAHEVLGIAAGRGDVLFGGEGGAVLTLAAGDAVLIPAGVGHKRLAASEDFLVVGAYPPGQENPGILTENELDYARALTLIDKLTLPETDPIAGPAGPLVEIWASIPPPVSGSPLATQTRYG